LEKVTMNAAEEVIAEFAARRLLTTHYPALAVTGVRDIGPAVHSHFLSYLLALGNQLGYSAVVDSPLAYQPTGQEQPSAELIRPDSTWYDRGSGQPVVIAEFERHEPRLTGKLRDKAQNLVAFYHQAGSAPTLILFIYWVMSGQTANLSGVTRVFRETTIRRGMPLPRPICPVLIFKCVMQPTDGNLLTIREIVNVSGPEKQ
jgi:hypothetical protein